MNQGHLIDLGPEMFCDGDEEVISWKGENYYRACGVQVTKNKEAATFCVKRIGHPGVLHEDFDGEVSTGIQAPQDIDYEPSLGSAPKIDQIRDVVFQALGTASMCWNPRPSDQIFDSEQASRVGDGLMRAIDKILGGILSLTEEMGV